MALAIVLLGLFWHGDDGRPPEQISGGGGMYMPAAARLVPAYGMPRCTTGLTMANGDDVAT